MLVIQNTDNSTFYRFRRHSRISHTHTHTQFSATLLQIISLLHLSSRRFQPTTQRVRKLQRDSSERLPANNIPTNDEGTFSPTISARSIYTVRPTCISATTNRGMIPRGRITREERNFLKERDNGERKFTKQCN